MKGPSGLSPRLFRACVEDFVKSGPDRNAVWGSELRIASAYVGYSPLIVDPNSEKEPGSMNLLVRPSLSRGNHHAEPGFSNLMPISKLRDRGWIGAAKQ